MSRNYNRFSEFSLNFLIQNWACTASTLLPLLITATSKQWPICFFLAVTLPLVLTSQLWLANLNVFNQPGFLSMCHQVATTEIRK